MKYYIIGKIGAAVFVTGCVSVVMAQVGASGITGTVLSEDGKPVAGAFVTVSQITASRGAPERKSSLPTPKDGAFSLLNLPAGDYRICVQAPSTEFLDPCAWAMPVIVKLVAGQTLTGQQLKLKKGTTLQVHIDDPAQYLAKNEGKVAGAHLLIGVWSVDGLFHAGQVTSKGNAGRDHSVVVPFDTPLRLSAHSDFFQLKDEKGNAIDKKGASIPFQVASGGPPKKATFSVTGTGKK